MEVFVCIFVWLRNQKKQAQTLQPCPRILCILKMLLGVKQAGFASVSVQISVPKHLTNKSILIRCCVCSTACVQKKIKYSQTKIANKVVPLCF